MSNWKERLAKIIPAETYGRNQFGGTIRRMKLSDEEIEDLFNFVDQELKAQRLEIIEQIKGMKKENNCDFSEWVIDKQDWDDLLERLETQTDG